MKFSKGNKAAAKTSKKQVAEMIRLRLEKDGDTLSNAQFVALVSKFTALTAKRRRRNREKPEAEKATASFADRLTGEEAEMHKMIEQIEAEQLEARRKKWRSGWEAKQQEPKPITS